MTKGVDISVHNGNVDFNALKAAGIQFVIIRCGYGSDFTYQDDERFADNVRKAEAADMPWGTYLYSYALNRDMAKSEAQHINSPGNYHRNGYAHQARIFQYRNSLIGNKGDYYRIPDKIGPGQ